MKSINKKAENLFLLRPWSKDLEFRLARISPEGTHSDIIKILKTDIKEAVNLELANTLKVEFDQDSPRP